MIEVRPSRRASVGFMGLAISGSVAALVHALALHGRFVVADIGAFVFIILLSLIGNALYLRNKRILLSRGVIQTRNAFGFTSVVAETSVLRAIYAPQVVDGARAVSARLILRGNSADTVLRLSGQKWRDDDLELLARSFGYVLETVPGPIGGAALVALHPDAASYFERHTLFVFGVLFASIALMVTLAFVAKALYS